MKNCQGLQKDKVVIRLKKMILKSKRNGQGKGRIKRKEKKKRRDKKATQRVAFYFKKLTFFDGLLYLGMVRFQPNKE